MLTTCAVTLPFIGDLNLSGFILIAFIVCFVSTLAFEFVNGFHDTANAVATVIYTKTLKPHFAIVWSGIWNFLGVLLIGTAVAMSILKLVPLDKIITLPVQVGACLVFAVLLSSILWNLGSWYFGIPLSSTHTLIGAMIGASLCFHFYYADSSVNWSKAGEIGLSLLISPIIGFGGSALLMLAEKRLIKSEVFFHIPEGDDDKPPIHIRILLIITCTLVSFFHGSNDGQKGVGLMMLVLIAFLPARFALNHDITKDQINAHLNIIEQTLHKISPLVGKQKESVVKLDAQILQVKKELVLKDANTTQEKFQFRRTLQMLTGPLKKLIDDKKYKLKSSEKDALGANLKGLTKVTDFAPIWVLIAIALSLGLGTMIGWKRIVITIGEKIGCENMNYAQGATAEIVAAATIGLSTGFGLPVSTTHVLASGVAGAMAATNGKNKLNYSTLKNIAMAWILTLPVAILLALGFFALFHLFL